MTAAVQPITYAIGVTYLVEAADGDAAMERIAAGVTGGCEEAAEALREYAEEIVQRSHDARSVKDASRLRELAALIEAPVFQHASGPYLLGNADAENLAAPVVNYGDDYTGERAPELTRADDIDAEASQ